MKRRRKHKRPQQPKQQPKPPKIIADDTGWQIVPIDVAVVLDQPWFVIQVTATREARVIDTLRERGIQAFSPMLERVVTARTFPDGVLRRSKRHTAARYPGYVLAASLDTTTKADVVVETALGRYVLRDPWQSIFDLPDVIGPLGWRDPTDDVIRPVPLPHDVVARIVEAQNAGRMDLAPPVTIDVGSVVKILNGPFASFPAVVVRLNDRIATVETQIFGQPTPVVLELCDLEPAP